MSRPDKPPHLKFQDELLTVFIRWFEESDLDEVDMEEAALAVIDNFCGKTLDFDSDFDFFDEAS